MADLLTGADAPIEDPFAEARRAHPDHKLIRYIYREPLGMEFIAKLAPDSAYFSLFDTEQTYEIQRRDPPQPQ